MKVPFVSALLSISLLLVSGPGRSQSKRELRACASEEKKVERLQCFDALVEKYRLSPRPQRKQHGRWLLRQDTSPIDDSETVLLSVVSAQPIVVKAGRARPSLHIRCLEGDLDVYIGLGVYLGMGETTVTTRLDRREAETQGWGISTDYRAIFAEDAEAWLKRLANGNSLVVRLTPYGESPVTFSLDVGGLKDAADPLLRACRLPPLEPYVCTKGDDVIVLGMRTFEKPDGSCVPASRATLPRHIKGDLTISGPGFVDLDLLSPIEAVEGNLVLKETDIASMSGLEQLAEIGGSLSIAGNVSLRDLNVLPNLKRLEGSFTESGNHAVDACSAVALWERILKVKGAANYGEFVTAELPYTYDAVEGCGFPRDHGVEDTSGAPSCQTHADCPGATWCDASTRRCVGG